MASRSAVMISGERSANCASSFLRSAGASCAAAALRWRTRPARSSSTAGSGMPATTALTAAASTGLIARTSSREATDIMQPPRHQRRGGDADENRGGADQRQFAEHDQHRSARPAASRMMAECRNRSGHGEKKEERRFVYRHRAGLLPRSGPHRQAPVSPRSRT